ncbi:MAG: D-aminoacylase, partial [SAR324 cluster bacterium]|nr:D-aminoacylase [SAR324 cluster bacterium]
MEFDLILENGLIHDGSGKAPYVADVGIRDDRIVDIGDLRHAEVAQRINTGGNVVCPGFIDVHSHADLVIHMPHHPDILEPLLRQGITTFVGGNCGMGMAPLSKNHVAAAFTYMEAMISQDANSFIRWEKFGEFIQALDADGGLALNCGLLVPHGMLRIAAQGLKNELPSPDAMKTMRYDLEEGLEAGALGMSTGLMYFPGVSSDEQELETLAEILVRNDAVFTSHLRSYSNTLPQAIEEVLEISRKTNVKVQISHFFWLPHVSQMVDAVTNSAARAMAQLYKKVKVPLPLDLPLKKQLKTITREIARGLPLGIDAMPTGTGFTHALAFFPPWVLTGDQQKV